MTIVSDSSQSKKVKIILDRECSSSNRVRKEDIR